MDAADKRMLEREALRNMIQQWNANRLDLFELSEPNENLEFHGVMRFYFQDSGQKIATKCIRVASDATVSDVIETLIEKFRPDMRMLSLGSYSLWETHGPEDERKLEPHEKPLLVQLNWHADDREGRFLLKCTTGNEMPLSAFNEKSDQNFKRKLSKREKKELKKKEKLSRLKSDANNENRPAEKLYKEMPETSFTRSISNPEAVMRRRRQQKLERKLQQFRSKDGGPDTGGTLKIYGSSLSPDVPYKTLLLSIRDTAAAVLREMLDKYGLSRQDPAQYCIVQVDAADNSEYILEDDECPLAIVMTHQHRGSIMFHVRRRPVDTQPRRRKKKSGAGSGNGASRPGNEPALVEVTPDGTMLENGRRVRVTDVVEVGSGNGMSLQLYGPSIQSRHCVIATTDGGNAYSVTPLHPDAQVYMNGQRILHTQRLQHGNILKFGRVSTFRFVDPTQESILNRNLSQSQHFGSGSIYDRSPTSPGRDLSAEPLDERASPVSHDAYSYNPDPLSPYNNNTLKLDNESLVEHKDEYREEHEHNGNRSGSNYKDNYETTFDLDGNVETKSICSAKSGGSGHDGRMNTTVPAARPGQEAILPAVLEFPESGQAQFLAAVITRLDPHAPAFKLAPVYTLYLCARYRASTHYRPELTPTERAHKLTAFLHHVATLIHATVQERCTDSAAQAFWMANASELLHFLKCDRHISSFSTQAQDLLPTTVQNAFSNLVSCFQEELSPALVTLNRQVMMDATEATAPTLQALAAAMVLLRRCRVNAALTIQLFSHLFHFINAVCFNKLVTEPGLAEARWGAALSARLALLGAWAERQGLELAADCHLARSHQAARLIQGDYRTPEEVRSALSACFKLNSAQVRALLAPRVTPDVLEAATAHARALADELYRADGREITLEESEWLGVGLLIPGDGFSAEVVRAVPPGLAEFVAPLQRGGLCRLAHQPHSAGVWTVYMNGYGSTNTRRPPEPRVHIIQLNKNSNGMGLSIVAAKGAGQSKLGIYIKSVVPGGAAAADGRLAAGDQLLSVDGHSLVGITQEKAAEYLVRTGPTVTLEVAKQGAVLHGLATLLHQPAYNQKQTANPGGMRRASERDLPSRLAAEPVKPSKSTPALHHAVSPPVHNHHGTISSPIAEGPTAWAGKSRSSHNLSAGAAPVDGFYQNVPHMQDRWSTLRSSNGSNRPQSAHFSAASPADHPPESPLHHQHSQSTMSIRAAKLAEMSEEVSRRQQHAQMQQQMQQQYAMSPPQKQPMPHQHMNQMTPLHLANPHMNIPNQQIHGNQMPHMMSQMSPQSHLNQSQLSPQSHLNQTQLSPQSHLNQSQSQLNQSQPHLNQSQLHLNQSQLSPQSHLNQSQISPQSHLGQSQMLSQSQSQLVHNVPHQQMYHNQHGPPPQRYEWHPPGPPSPQRSQPPVAPKPQGVRRPETEHDDQMMSPQQPQMNNNVQPEDEWYVASSAEPPAVSLYGVEGGRGANRAPPARDPWQREEREREAEARRQANRARRDATLTHLLSLGASRTPVQNQQLRALQLERDFERRATQQEQDETPDTPQQVLERQSPPLEMEARPPHPPKSILKSNRSDIANGHTTHDNRVADDVSRVSAVSAGVSALTVAEGPPPPERGSSFAVMASRTSAPMHAAATVNNNVNVSTANISSTRDKRVSFHAPPPAAPPAPPTSTPPPLHDEPATPTHAGQREDPDRFIEEAENMLASPISPATNTPHTPGVIGAQEVYRDPRTRRLAEQQARAPAAPVPEQLSFKEKMKMFALESGEASTPKDKVKISRAQRDIDAVH